ncbi:MAG: ABC transporter ATP-binding protein [Bauldia sp.]|nr:ABC transporter ATP-binding protein [Bauldia sp.]
MLVPDPSAAVLVEDLSKSFRGVAAVNGISFHVAAGSITGLLGGNGAGKTTTIGMILGLVTPSAGRVSVLGHDIATDRHAILHRINFQSPYADLPHRLTARQNLRVFARLYGVPDAEGRIEELAVNLDLTAFMDRPAGRLSAGQKTRLALAKAMINSPELLLLDEPTASLDPDTADWIRSHLDDYRRDRGATILLASHNMPEVERLCDQVILMKDGRIVDRGGPADLIARYGRTDLEEVFLDVARNRGAAAGRDVA